MSQCNGAKEKDKWPIDSASYSRPGHDSYWLCKYCIIQYDSEYQHDSWPYITW